jgi:hypothetical protein
MTAAAEPRIDRPCEEVGFQTHRTSARTEAEVSAVLLSLANSLGTPLAGRRGRLVEPILPRDEQHAEAYSLSALHGLGELPMHMDTGHYLRPARFLLIGCVDPGSSRTQTRLVDTRNLKFAADKLALLHSAPLLVRSGRHSFYSTVLDRVRPYFRYDPGCMEPIDRRGEEAMATMRAAVARSPADLHDWRGGDILLIDNWRMLHGRTPSAADERLLLRVSVQ